MCKNTKITTNPDAEVVEYIRQKLKENDVYCPCRIVKNEDNKCICKSFREKVERGELGECHCGLYIVTEVEE